MALVFIYGTLRRNHINAHHMRNAQYLGIARTKEKAYKMIALIDYEYPYPAVMLGGECHIEGELYEVDAPLMNFLDDFEGAEYKRGEIELEDGRQAQVYLYNPEALRPCIDHHPQIFYDPARNSLQWREGEI